MGRMKKLSVLLVLEAVCTFYFLPLQAMTPCGPSGEISSLQESENADGQIFGKDLPEEDLRMDGIGLRDTFASVMRKKGRPDLFESVHGLYGYRMDYQGIRLYTLDAGVIKHVDLIDTEEKGYSTAKGISVGDRLKKVWEAYGKPDNVLSGRWFYGKGIRGSGMMRGIVFYHDGERVTGISITNGE